MPKKPPRNNQRNRAPRTVQSAASILQRVMSRAGSSIGHQNQLVESLLSKLPETLHAHVVGVVEKPDELVILVDTAAWAARVRLALAAVRHPTEGRRLSVRLTPAGATDH